MNALDGIAKLRARGWALERINGSSHIMTKEGRAVPVQVYGKRDLGAVFWLHCSYGKRVASAQ